MSTRHLADVLSPYAHILGGKKAAKDARKAAKAKAPKVAKAIQPSPRDRVAAAQPPAPSPFAHLRGAAARGAFGRQVSPTPSTVAAPDPEAQSHAIGDRILAAGRKARGELTGAEIKAERRGAGAEDKRAQAAGDFILNAGRKARGESP